jgi:hypothetical protein
VFRGTAISASAESALRSWEKIELAGETACATRTTPVLSKLGQTLSSAFADVGLTGIVQRYQGTGGAPCRD